MVEKSRKPMMHIYNQPKLSRLKLWWFVVGILVGLCGGTTAGVFIGKYNADLPSVLEEYACDLPADSVAVHECR